MAKINRNWFFTTSGDTKIGGFWQRFVGGGISKPTEQTFKNLTDSVAFHTEVDSAAKVDNTGALADKQGLVITATGTQVKSGSDLVLGATGGTLAVKPSQLPTIESATNDFTVTTDIFDGVSTATQDPFEIIADASTTTRNKYVVKFKAAFVKWLLRRVLPAGGTIGQAIVKTSNDDFNYTWGTVASAATGDVYKTTSTTPINIGTTAIGATITLTVPTGLAYTKDQRVSIISATSNANFLNGLVTSYSGTTLSVKVDAKGGTGTPTTLNINLAGNQVPDWTALSLTDTFSLETINRIPTWVLKGVVTNSNQFWISPGGSDTTGDGSINKPWATFSKAKTEIQNIADTTAAKITLMVIGGSYTNNVNMAIQKGNGLFYNYSIFCFPGVTISQSVTSFYNNSIVNGYTDVYGSPDMVTTDTLGGAYLINIATKRNSGTQTIQYHQYKNISYGTALGVKIGSSVNGSAGPALCYFTASTVNGATSPSIETTGEDTLAVITCSSVSNSVSGGVGILLNGGGSINISNTRFTNATISQNFTCIRVNAIPAFNGSWITGNGVGFVPSYFITECVAYLRNDSAASTYFIHNNGLGDQSTKVMVDNCKYFAQVNSVGAFFFGNTSADSITIRHCNSFPPISSVGTIAAYGSDPTVSRDTAKTFYFLPQYGF